MNSLVTVLKAAELAAKWHAGQKRKGEAAEPYLNHLIEVASLVGEASDGNQDYVIAALLHDAVEDQGVSLSEIEAIFGDKVAGIVAEVTDDKAISKAERKALQVANAPRKSEGACFVKLADKTSNLRSILDSPPPWPADRKREYVTWAKSVVGGLRFKPPSLLAKFDEVAATLMRSLG